jgi:hypothetical protein
MVHVPEGAAYPTPEAFTPSLQEERDAIARELPVRVSVWDRSRTTLREAMDQASGDQMAAYDLAVAKVMQVRARLSAHRLRVVRDVDPEITGPGCEGHCGIEGLDRLPGTPRHVVKTLKVELVRCLTPVRP